MLVLTAFNEEVTGSLGVPEENGQPLASVGLPAVDVSIMRTRTGRRSKLCLGFRWHC